MTDLDFKWYRRVIPKSDQEPALLPFVTLSRMVGGEIGPEASPKDESKSNGEVERAVQSVHELARTLRDFLEQQS